MKKQFYWLYKYQFGLISWFNVELSKNNILAKQLALLAQCWLKQRPIQTHQAGLNFVGPPSPWPLLVMWLKPNVSPSPVFEGCPKKLFDLEDTYWSSFCTARYFSWNVISRGAWCIWRALWGGLWHSGTNESLCCLVGLTSSPDFSSWTDCWRVWWEIPVVHLTQHWTHLIFTFLTEAAVNSITTLYCSHAGFSLG